MNFRNNKHYKNQIADIKTSKKRQAYKFLPGNIG